MVWDVNWPDGTKSVKDNRSAGNANMNYIETELQDDHFFDEDANKDGHHKKVETPDLAADPTALSTSMDSQYYVRKKTSAESPDAQKTEPFVYSEVAATKHYLQLGFRAMIQFEMLSSSPYTITLKYAHNCTVARTGEGLFTLTFTNALPTDNYIAFGTAMRSSGNALVIATQTAAAKGTSITTSTYKFGTYSTRDSARDPIVVSLAICGG